MKNNPQSFFKPLLLLLCLVSEIATAQHMANFEVAGKLQWMKRSIISNPEKLTVKKYVCETISGFEPKKTQTIYQRKARLHHTELPGKFSEPAEMSFKWKAKPTQPVSKISSSPLPVKDNSRYNISYADRAHGFVADAVEAIAEDDKNNVWLATDRGLVKYDGNFYYVYSVRSGLISNTINTIWFDKNSGLWVATAEGIQLLNNDTLYEPVFSGLSNSSLNVIRVNTDERGNKWINTANKGALKINTAQRTVQQFDTACGLPSNNIKYTILDRKGHYWFAGKGLVKVEGNNITQWFSSKNYFNEDEWLVLQEDTDTMWVGTFDNCVFKITPTDTIQLSPNKNFGGRVFSLRKVAGNAVWFTMYGNGVCYLNGDVYQVFDETNGLSGSSAYSLMEDSYGNMWIGTIGDGFSRINKTSVMLDPATPGFLKTAAAIKTDKNGNRWYFLNGAGLHKETETGYEYITNKAMKPLPSVRHFMNGILNEDGTAWLAAYSYGIALYDKKNITFYYYSDDPVERVVLEAEKDRNNTLWFSTMTYGLVYKKGEDFYHITTANGLLSDKSVVIRRDNTGAILCLSEYGLQRISNDTIYDLYVDNTRYEFIANVIHATAAGHYLIASADKGLLLLKSNELFRLESKAAFDFNSVTNIMEDSKGLLWFTNDQGILNAKMNGPVMSDLLWMGNIGKNVFSKMNRSGYIDEMDIPHWSADIGMLRYRPEFADKRQVSPVFRYLSATINDSIKDLNNPLTLYSGNLLKLNYSIICWGHEDEMIQSYVLMDDEGRDTLEYAIGNKGIIELRKFSEGSYRLALLAKINGTKYYSAWIPLKIKPHWYASGWFYLVCVILLVAAIIFFFRWRSLRLLKSKALLEDTVAKRTAALSASLDERTVLLKEIHHRVKNNLQVIGGLLELQKEEITDEKIKAAFNEGQSRVRSMALIHQNLYQHESLANIRFQSFVTDLVMYVRELYNDKSKTISVDVSGDDVLLDIDTAVPLGLIINELLTNAFKYAAGRQGEAKVVLHLKYIDKGEYQLTYKDEGPGIKGTVSFETATSLGLRLIKGLIAQVGGTVTYHYDNGACFTFLFKGSEARSKP